MTDGEIIRKERLRLQESQRIFAMRMRLTACFLQAIEMDHVKISDGLKLQLASTLNKTVGELFHSDK